MSIGIRAFFDVHCVNSWIGVKTLRSLPAITSTTCYQVDYLPIVSKRLYVHTKQKAEDARFVHLTSEELTKETARPIKSNPLGIGVPDDYQRIQAEALNDRSSNSAMFLAAIKLHFPDRYLEALDLLGETLAEKRLRFEYREADFLTTCLCDHRINEVLVENIEEAGEMGAICAPIYEITTGDERKAVDDIGDVLERLRHVDPSMKVAC